MAETNERKQSSLYYLFAIFAFIISILVYCYLNNYFSQLVLINTSYGTLQGFATTSRDGRTFYQFNSVRYAKPPVGSLRFQPPVSIEPWEGVQDSTRMTPSCSQYDLILGAFRGQEDCLFINIFTPAKPSKKPLPVMIFFHGGIFMFGGTTEFYGGRYFMDEDVVLVTVNYRLGALGFLNTGDETVPGNMGLKDQLEAIKFVKKIIADFGGDSSRITLVGESAGGVSVHMHMLSPKSKGYFRNAISQSGSAFCPWGFTRSPREQALRLGSQVGCPTNNSRDLVDCLTKLDTWELIKPHEKLLDPFIDTLDIFGPSVENVTSSEAKATAFLTEYPYKLAAEGRTHPVPYIAGVNSHEGCFRSSLIAGQTKMLERLSNKWDDLASPALFLHQNDSITLGKVRKFHFGDNTREIKQEDYQPLTDATGDWSFSIPTRDAAVLHSRLTKSPTYLYYYAEKGDVSIGSFQYAFSEDSLLPRAVTIFIESVKSFIYKNFNIDQFDPGTCHADELFLFYSIIPTSLLDINQGQRHYQFSKDLVKLWVSFARDGKPGKFRGVTWEELQSETKDKSPIPKYLLLTDNRQEMIDEPFHKRLSFWRDLNLPRNLNPVDETRFPQQV